MISKSINCVLWAVAALLVCWHGEPLDDRLYVVALGAFAMCALNLALIVMSLAEMVEDWETGSRDVRNGEWDG